MTDGTDAAARPSDQDGAAERLEARRAARGGIGVALATSAYGISFGALAVTSGFDVWQTCVLSLLMFTGGSQFAFIGVIGAGGVAAAPAAIGSALLLGLRNAAYAMRMAPIVAAGPWWRRVIAIPFTIDESTAMALAQRSARAQRVGFWVTGIGIFIGWNVFTLVGAIAGEALGDPRRYGLDAAAAGAFLALLWPRLRGLQPIAVGIAAAVVAVVLTPWLLPGVPVLVAAVVAIAVGWFGPAGRSTGGRTDTTRGGPAEPLEGLP